MATVNKGTKCLYAAPFDSTLFPSPLLEIEPKDIKNTPCAAHDMHTRTVGREEREGGGDGAAAAAAVASAAAAAAAASSLMNLFTTLCNCS